MYLLAKYNTQTDIYFPMVKRGVVDLAVTADWTPATGDTKVSKDGGAVANTTNNPAIASGTSWKLTLTATELSCLWLTVQIVDSATKAVEDQFLIILTYGNASAFFPAPDYQDTAGFGLSRLDAAVTSRATPAQILATPANLLTTDASGRVTVGSIVNGAIAAATFAANALDAVWSTAARTLTAFGFSVTVGTNNDKTGYTLSAAGVQAIWDALTSALTTAGSIGLRLVTDIDATISSRLATSGYAAAPTTTQIWDEAVPGSHAAGTAAAKLNSASAAGDPWGTALPGSYGAGTGGNILGNLVASIWNAVAATYNTAGSLGQKLNAAGGAADPLTNAVPGTYPAGSAGYVLGTLPTGNGAIEWTYTLTRSDNGLPIAGATIEITNDLGGTVGLAGPLVTNSLGQVTAFLPAGTVYVWRQANGYSFTNPQVQSVS